jgi:hypothetical protein
MTRPTHPVNAPRVDDKPSDVLTPDQRGIYSTCPAGMLPKRSLRDALIHQIATATATREALAPGSRV